MPKHLEAAVDKFTFRVATDRVYSPDGVWAMAEDNRVRIGLTDYVQQRNGDAAFVHVRAPGTAIAAGEEFAELETIKANVSLFAPAGGTIVEVNPALNLCPEIVNQDPYDEGWLAIIEAVDWQTDRVRLLDPDVYLSAIRLQAEEELNSP